MVFFRHDDLIVRNGLYADMWSEQRKSNLPIKDEEVILDNSVSSTSKRSYHTNV